MYKKGLCITQNVKFCSSQLMFPLPSVLKAPPPSHHSYGCRHYPKERVHGGRCSSPWLLVNTINNRSPSLSLHLCCLLPVALKPWTCGGLRLPPIDGGGERERGERQIWSGGSALSPARTGMVRKPAFMTITSRVCMGVLKNTEGLHRKSTSDCL